MSDPNTLRTTNDVETLSQWLYGGVSVTARRGVVHVCALQAPGDGTLRNLHVGEASPKSAYDRFALELARARADAIIVTGKILREEPALSYAGAPEAMRAWRARAGHDALPLLVVLTHGEGLDLAHPALTSGGVRPVIFTSAQAAAALRQAHDGEAIAIVGHPEPSIEAAIAWARGEGSRTIVLEAGPSTVRPLYDAGVIDELALSVFRGPVAAAARGATVFSEAEVTGLMGPRTPPRVVDGARGVWELQLFPAVRT